MISITDKKIKETIINLSLEEKAQLCSGSGNWNFRGIKRLGIKDIIVSDGPHGVRKVAIDGTNDENDCSEPSTCFPTASALAASWNRELLKNVGKVIESEAAAQRVSIVLGPGANIKRSPLCGRNFEYFSEDPYISGELAASFIDGIQESRTGTSLKHFAVNNQERLRMTIDAIVDERTLREIYLAGFEIAIKKSKPWTIMCAYNMLNGSFLSDHKYLLNDILRDEWNFEGIVVSDWGACNDRQKALEAGLEIEMPDSGSYNVEEIIKAVKNGKMKEDILDQAASRILRILLAANEKLNSTNSKPRVNLEDHHQRAKEAALESIVLLKNSQNVLPLSKDDKITVVGAFAKTPRYQGAGSSHINPTKIDCFWDQIKKVYPKAVFSEGYSLKGETDSLGLIKEAVTKSENSDKIIILCGLPDEYESEGFDRLDMKLPESHNRLVEELIKTGKPVIVCLSNGSPVEIPWHKDAAAILETYLYGQAGASALADILTGKENPSGKLAESFPLCLEDTPSKSFFPGGPRQVEYREGIYIGYRYYETAEVPVLYPFGHGLSYTNFDYRDIEIEKTKNDYEMTVKIKVKNTGKSAGKEVVQLYISPPVDEIHRPVKELKGFEKIYLAPSEEKTLEISLDFRSFACRSVKLNKWVIPGGKYTIMAGASSSDIRLETKIELPASDENITETANLTDYFNIRKGISSIQSISDSCFQAALGHRIPSNILPKEWDRTTTITDFSKTWIGKIIYKRMQKEAASKNNNNANSAGMFEAQAKELPLRAIAQLSSKDYNMEMVDALILLGKGRIIIGALSLLKAYKKLKSDNLKGI